MGEKPVLTVKAHVFTIEPSAKKTWLPASGQAINVSFFYDAARRTYRVISVDGAKAVVNSTIAPNMNFTKTSQKFGQWSDSKAGTVYGLGFSSELDLKSFAEKFSELRDLTRQQHQQLLAANGAVNSRPFSPPLQRAAQTNNALNTSLSSLQSAPDRPLSPPVITAPVVSPLPPPSQGARPMSPLGGQTGARLQANAVAVPNVTSAPGVDWSLVNGQPTTRSSNLVQANKDVSNASPKLSHLSESQIKYENDRLKLALAQSSTNAKKWEVELQTLKNNNVRLTTALQESAQNVEEWKRQLASFKEENAKLRKRVQELEESKGAEEVSALQKELKKMTEDQRTLEIQFSVKKQEVEEAKSRISTAESENTRLKDSSKRLEGRVAQLATENSQLRSELANLRALCGSLPTLGERFARCSVELEKVRVEFQSVARQCQKFPEG